MHPKKTQIGYPERCHNHCFYFQLILVALFFRGRLSFSKKIRSSSFSKKNWGCLPNHCFYCFLLLYFFWGRLPLEFFLRFSIFKYNIVFTFQYFWLHYFFDVIFHLKKIEVVFLFQNNWGRLPFSKILRSSSIYLLVG